jgi:hypothetical protein
MTGHGRVKAREGTVIGPVRLLDVEGEWLDEYSERFLSKGCNGVTWSPPDRVGVNCKPIVRLEQRLDFIRIRAAKRMDDEDLAGLTRLRFLDATTLARNDLDLSSLTQLEILLIDDRQGLTGLTSPVLRGLTLYKTTRALGSLQSLPRLEKVHFESPRRHEHDLGASMPALQHLRIVGGRVSSLSALNAPSLEVLTIEGVEGGVELDLAPLAALGQLTHFSIDARTPMSLRNAGQLKDVMRVNFSTGRNVTV